MKITLEHVTFMLTLLYVKSVGSFSRYCMDGNDIVQTCRYSSTLSYCCGSGSDQFCCTLTQYVSGARQCTYLSSVIRTCPEDSSVATANQCCGSGLSQYCCSQTTTQSSTEGSSFIDTFKRAMADQTNAVYVILFMTIMSIAVYCSYCKVYFCC